MSSILRASGFVYLESLTDFSTRYPNIPVFTDSDLEKVWICHKNIENIPKFDEINSCSNENYFNLYNKFTKKSDSSKDFISLLTDFRAVVIFQKIYSHFKGFLTEYLIKNCYLFFNWGVNCFEPIVDHFEIHEKIKKEAAKVHKSKRNWNDSYVCHSGPSINLSDPKDGLNCRKNSCLNYKCNTACLLSKKVTLKNFETAVKNCKPYFNLPRNPNDPLQESFNLKKIMYDIKEKPQWPKKHILSTNDSEKLLMFIINLPVGSNNFAIKKPCYDSSNWVKLKSLLQILLRNHKLVERRNGYGRILKEHLKSVKIVPSRRLIPISKSVVCSYIIDILRKVLPLELFSCNHLRKKFFCTVVQIISASREENFIWHTLLQDLLKNKSQIPWCKEISDTYTQTQVMLKLFKFIVINFMFVVIKNNFYVTETGSSGFDLRFYKKSDVESAKSFCLKKLLYYNHLKHLKKQDYEGFSLERKWIDTGVLDVREFTINLQKTMNASKQFVQEIASIRFLPKNDWSEQMRIITYIRPKKTNLTTSSIEANKLLNIFKNRLDWRKKQLLYLKLFIEFLVHKIGFGIEPVPNNPKLEVAWNKAISLKESFGKLYFVKADIADAFDSVKYDLLSKILKGAYSREKDNKSIQLKKITEWKQCKGKIKKVSRLSISNQPQKNSVLINRSLLVSDSINLEKDSNFVEIIEQIVMQQRVEINGKIFKFTKGLAQGSAGKFSPQLCEIYYSSMDRLYFEDIIHSANSILLRGVDDYLLITADIQKAERFLEIVRGGIEYFNARFNSEKLISNLIEDIHEFPYLGLVFNLNDMSVKPNYFKFSKKNIFSTMKLTDTSGNVHFNKNYFFEKKSICLNSLKLQSILLNKSYNNIKTIRQTVFQACLIQSLRIMTLSKYLFKGKTSNELVIWKVVMKTRNKISNTVNTHSGLDKYEFDWLFFFAVLCIFQKFSGQFKSLLVFGRYKLKKCERGICNSGAQLLPKFLKNDLFDEMFWKKINNLFRELITQTKPFFTDSCKKSLQ